MANTSGNNAGENFGQKVRGAWNTVEGMYRAGDKLRGGILDFVDSATGTGGHHAETDVGDAKMRQGIADTRQRAPTAASTAAGPAAGAQPTSTSATAPTTTGSTL